MSTIQQEEGRSLRDTEDGLEQQLVDTGFPRSKRHIVASAISCILCPGFCYVTGIVALVLSIYVHISFKSGEIAKANKIAKFARFAMITTLVLGALTYVVLIVTATYLLSVAYYRHL